MGCRSTAHCRCGTGLLLAAILALLAAGCSTKPVPFRPPFWPSWATNIDRSIGNQLAVAAGAWDQLLAAEPGSPEAKSAEGRYERAVTAVLELCGRRQSPREWPNQRVYQGRSGAYRLTLPEKALSAAEIPTRKFDRLKVPKNAPKLPPGGAVEEGIGVPVVGQIARTEETSAEDPMLPLNGAQHTLTALLQFGPAQADEPRQVTLRLINPLHEKRPDVTGKSLPLAADYGYSKRLALMDGYLRNFALLGLTHPNKVAPNARLYLLDPYDPKRIPLVFVHGLLASPHNWFSIISAINADPELRARYQPWYFLYAGGLDVPYSAHQLRQSLREARERLDPDHNDPGMNQMVLVGHSMGGLLCRLQTIDSEDLFLRACFNCGLDELKLTPENRQRLADSFQFKRQPYVKRLIFVAVPHRGSKMADVKLWYRLRRLIQLPEESMLLTKEVLTGNADALAPQMRTWGDYAFLSVGTLSPKHPYLEALNKTSIPVPHHSIIGYIGRKPLEQSSDGVVPYLSAHLETGSEVIVPSWHGLTDEPEVVAEVVARLKQHLQEIH